MMKSRLFNPLFMLLAVSLVAFCVAPFLTRHGLHVPAVVVALAVAAGLGVFFLLCFSGHLLLFLRQLGESGSVKIRDAYELIRTMRFTHSADTTADTVYLLGGRPMLAMNTATANNPNIYVYSGVIEYTTDTGAAWTAGDTVYWDDSAKKFTKTSTSNTKCGIAVDGKLSAATTALIHLIPIP